MAKKTSSAPNKAPAKPAKSGSVKPAPAAKKLPAKPTPPKAAPTKPANTKPAPAKPAPAKPSAAKTAPAPAKPTAAAKPTPASKNAAPAKPVAAPKPAPLTKADLKAVKAAKLAAEIAKRPAANLAQAPAGTVGGKPAAPPVPAKPTNPNQPPRPIKRPKAPPPVTVMPPGMGRLMDPKSPLRKPLIPSGPKALAQRPLGAHSPEPAEQPKVEGKTPYNKRELERFRLMLVRKRAELVGDVNTMENEALRGQSGANSSSPSHMAEQGSEAFDQSLSLDLAAADRKLIREIDDALDRIKNGTYGLCQITGKPIKAERLEELPWARYSIEAARELERQAMRS